jgi:hypothetical protein
LRDAGQLPTGDEEIFSVAIVWAEKLNTLSGRITNFHKNIKKPLFYSSVEYHSCVSLSHNTNSFTKGLRISL